MSRQKADHVPALAGWPSSLQFLFDYEYTAAASKVLDCQTKPNHSAHHLSLQTAFGVRKRVRISLIEDPQHPAFGQCGDFAKCTLEPRSFVMDYLGVVQTETEFDAKSDYCVSLDPRFGLCIDARKSGNEARFVNDFRGVAKKANVSFSSLRLHLRGWESSLVVIQSGKDRNCYWVMEKVLHSLFFFVAFFFHSICLFLSLPLCFFEKGYWKSRGLYQSIDGHNSLMKRVNDANADEAKESQWLFDVAFPFRFLVCSSLPSTNSFSLFDLIFMLSCSAPHRFSGPCCRRSRILIHIFSLALLDLGFNKSQPPSSTLLLLLRFSRSFSQFSLPFAALASFLFFSMSSSTFIGFSLLGQTLSFFWFCSFELRRPCFHFFSFSVYQSADSFSTFSFLSREQMSAQCQKSTQWKLVIRSDINMSYRWLSVPERCMKKCDEDKEQRKGELQSSSSSSDVLGWEE